LKSGGCCFSSLYILEGVDSVATTWCSCFLEEFTISVYIHTTIGD